MRNGNVPFNAYKRLTKDYKTPAWAGGALSDPVFSSAVAVGREEMLIRSAFYRCVNEIYALGVSPKRIYADIIYPEKYSEEKVSKILRLIKDLSDEEGVCFSPQSLTGASISEPVITLHAYSDETVPVKEKAQGYILMAGYVAAAASAYMAALKKDELGNVLPDKNIRKTYELCKKQSLKALKDLGVLVKPVSEGGVLAALWAIKEEMGIGFNVSLREMPILQETVEMTQYFEINPYALMGDGAAIVISSEPEKTGQMLLDAGFSVKVIGQVSAKNSGIILRGTEGSYIDRPSEDEIYKLIRGAI